MNADTAKTALRIGSAVLFIDPRWKMILRCSLIYGFGVSLATGFSVGGARV